MLLVSENTSTEGLRATKESLPVTEEATVNTDPKIPPQIQSFRDRGSFFCSGLFSALGIYCDTQVLGNEH